jgi:hypothetical protein
LRSGGTEAERRSAALELADVPEAAEPLVAALLQEPSSSAREAIVTALISIGTPEAAAGLAGLLRSEDVSLRNSAVEALQQMGPAAGAVVYPMLGAADPDQRIFAINVLETLRYPGARDLLLGVLKIDPDVNVGLAAVEGLSQVGEPDDTPQLLAFAARFPNEPFVGFAVKVACRRVSAGGLG